MTPNKSDKTKDTETMEKHGDSIQNSSSAKSSKKSGNSSEGKETTLRELLEAGLKDMYSAEKQLLEALPQMAKAADSDELQDAFYHHYNQTQEHVKRIEYAFMKLRLEPQEEHCEAMEGLVKEGKKIMDEFEMGPVCDSALIIAAQKIEHYEIASYGSLCELADVLGYGKVVDILGQTLDEEKETDDTLTDIATNVNDEAYDLSLQEA